MKADLKVKLLSQLFPILMSVICLCASLYFHYVKANIILHEQFLGVFLGMFSIGLINIICILIAYKNEADAQNNFKNEIAEKVISIMLSKLRIGQGVFDESIKRTLIPGDYTMIDILAHTSEQFFRTFNEIDFKCGDLRILLQDTSITEESPIVKDWEEFFYKKNSKFRQITIYKTCKDTDKLLYGMIINESHGIMGFYNPNTVKALNVLSFNKEITGQRELSIIIEEWFKYYLSNAKEVKKFPEEQEGELFQN